MHPVHHRCRILDTTFFFLIFSSRSRFWFCRHRLFFSFFAIAAFSTTTSTTQRQQQQQHRDSVSFVTLPLDHADELFPGTLKRATEARQELLWTLADADEVGSVHAMKEGCRYRRTSGWMARATTKCSLHCLPIFMCHDMRLCLCIVLRIMVGSDFSGEAYFLTFFLFRHSLRRVGGGRGVKSRKVNQMLIIGRYQCVLIALATRGKSTATAAEKTDRSSILVATARGVYFDAASTPPNKTVRLWGGGRIGSHTALTRPFEIHVALCVFPYFLSSQVRTAPRERPFVSRTLSVQHKQWTEK